MKKGKIYIGMYGRSGTSLLVAILGKLGFNTGFSDKDWEKDEGRLCRAGLESGWSTSSYSEFEVIKPALPQALKILGEELVRESCEAFIFPVRGLEKAQKSREICDEMGSTVFGGTANGRFNYTERASHFGEIVDLAAVWELPIKFLVFPKWTQDFDYFYEKLKPSFDIRNITKDQVRQVFEETIKPELIHDL